MAAIKPKKVTCRFCQKRPGIHGVTIREGWMIIWRAACTQCKVAQRNIRGVEGETKGK